MFRALINLLTKHKPTAEFWLCGTCWTFMPRVEAERLKLEHPECVTTVSTRCHCCDAVREFFSNLSPQGNEHCIDLTAESLDAGLQEAGYSLPDENIHA
jgi:RNase P subunit RPR2